VYVLAIDPGDAHVGIASWGGARPDDRDAIFDWEGVLAYEESAARAVDLIDQILAIKSSDAILVLEEFRLYPDRAREQSWSQMQTSEMIGAIKLVARRRGVKVVEQGASIKKATRAQLKKRGIKQVGKGGHARDAELHLAHYCLKEGLWTQRRPPSS